MTKFQIILTAVFILFIVVGVAVFATYKGNKSGAQLPAIEVWGTFPTNTLSQFVQTINLSLAQQVQVNYTQLSEKNFDKVFIEALARGGGPDAILIPQDMIYRHMDKIVAIPYTALPERDFKDTYIPEAELYLGPTGVIGTPFTVDPLVMYWNRDMFTNAGLPTYPHFWDEFSAVGKFINLKDENSNIRRSAIALGEFENVTHPREIFGTLLMQAGNPVTKQVKVQIGDSPLASTLGNTNGFSGTDSTQAALAFFTKFSNPSNPDYAWNRSLPSSKESFLAGRLATYFGFASEVNDIRSKNPNLNFDIAPLPQARKGTLRTTYGDMYGFSIVRSSKMPASAYSVIQTLITADALSKLSKLMYLPPVRRDLLTTGSTDPYLAIFYDGALISKEWLDPNKSSTSDILQTMIESVTSGLELPYQAIENADNKLNLSIQNL